MQSNGLFSELLSVDIPDDAVHRSVFYSCAADAYGNRRVKLASLALVLVLAMSKVC